MGEGRFYLGTNIAPIQSTIAGAQRRNGDGSNAFFGNDPFQVFGSSFNPFNARRETPITLGWKINNPAWPEHIAPFGQKHIFEIDLHAFASRFIEFEILRKGCLEHQGNALSEQNVVALISDTNISKRREN